MDVAVLGGNLERRWDRGGGNAEILRAKVRRGSLEFSGGDEMVEDDHGSHRFGISRGSGVGR